MNVDLNLIAITVVTLFWLVSTVLGYVTIRRLKCANNLHVTVATQLRDDIRALTAGGVGMSDHMLRLEQHVRRLSERQDQLELQDPVNQSYEHAIKLISNGADSSELIARCGLVRDEAELLLRMYKYDKAS